MCVKRSTPRYRTALRLQPAAISPAHVINPSSEGAVLSIQANCIARDKMATGLIDTQHILYARKCGGLTLNCYPPAKRLKRLKRIEKVLGIICLVHWNGRETEASSATYYLCLYQGADIQWTFSRRNHLTFPADYCASDLLPVFPANGGESPAGRLESVHRRPI